MPSAPDLPTTALMMQSPNARALKSASSHRNSPNPATWLYSEGGWTCSSRARRLMVSASTPSALTRLTAARTTARRSSAWWLAGGRATDHLWLVLVQKGENPWPSDLGHLGKGIVPCARD